MNARKSRSYVPKGNRPFDGLWLTVHLVEAGLDGGIHEILRVAALMPSVVAKKPLAIVARTNGATRLALAVAAVERGGDAGSFMVFAPDLETVRAPPEVRTIDGEPPAETPGPSPPE